MSTEKIVAVVPGVNSREMIKEIIIDRDEKFKPGLPYDMRITQRDDKGEVG